MKGLLVFFYPDFLLLTLIVSVSGLLKGVLLLQNPVDVKHFISNSGDFLSFKLQVVTVFERNVI